MGKVMNKRALLVCLVFCTVLAVVTCGCKEDSAGTNSPPKPASSSTLSPDEVSSASRDPLSSSVPEEQPALPEGRSWRDASGRVLAVGDFVSVLDDKVCLQKSDGSGAVVPLDQLCAEDRDFALNNGVQPEELMDDPSAEALSQDDQQRADLDDLLNDLGGSNDDTDASPNVAQVDLDSPHGRDELTEDIVVDSGEPVVPTAAGSATAAIDDSFDFGFDEQEGEGEPLAAYVAPDASGDIQRPARDETAAYENQRVVIPFNFVSEFDEGRYGGMVGEMLWTKLDREGGVVIPESMYDVEEVCKMLGATIGPDTTLEEVGRVVRDGFDADVGIWGKMERVEGFEWDVYDFTIYCVDFSGEEPNILYEAVNKRTEVVSEVPYIYVKNALDRLYGRQDFGAPSVDLIAEEKWRTGPNLIAGGDFQHGSNGVPIGWESRAGQHREPLGNLASWTSDPSDPQNRIIQFQFGPGVGNGYGVMYYSYPTPIDEGAKYRFQCRWRTSGPAVKIFIKCYDLMDTGYIVEENNSVGASSQYESAGKQLRECYRAQFNLHGPKNTWNTHTQDFTPRHTKYDPRMAKVDLYAYLGGGTVDFDDVIIRLITPVSTGGAEEDPRHSMDSDVTLEDMRANEERVRQQQEERERRRQEEETENE
jgi:hypothetical protein